MVTTRDQLIFYDLWQHRCMSTEQLAAVHWPECDVRPAQARLAKLASVGLIAGWDPPRPVTDDGHYVGRRPRVWRITSRGLRAVPRLLDGGGVPLGAPRSSWSWRAAERALQTNDVAVTLLAGVGDRGDWRGSAHGPLRPPVVDVGELAARRGVRIGGFGWRRAEPLRASCQLRLALGDQPVAWTPVQLVRTAEEARLRAALRCVELYLALWAPVGGYALWLVDSTAELRELVQIADWVLTGSVQADPSARVCWPARDGLLLLSADTLSERVAVRLPPAPTQGRWAPAARRFALPGGSLTEAVAA